MKYLFSIEPDYFVGNQIEYFEDFYVNFDKNAIIIDESEGEEGHKDFIDRKTKIHIYGMCEDYKFGLGFLYNDDLKIFKYSGVFYALSRYRNEELENDLIKIIGTHIKVDDFGCDDCDADSYCNKCEDLCEKSKELKEGLRKDFQLKVKNGTFNNY